jgi:hypothetical protein
VKRIFFAPRGRTVFERLARAALLGGVFALVIVAYQKHFQNVVEQAAAKGTVADAAGILSSQDRVLVLDQAAELRRRFGLELAVRLGGTPKPPGQDDHKTLYLYLSPDCRGSLVVAPALVASALPAGLTADLGREHLDAACRDGRAREGVLATLGLLIDALDEAAGRGKGEGS